MDAPELPPAHARHAPAPAPHDTGGSPLSVSLVTTCKGRRHHLERTLGHMLRQRFDRPCEVVVVDYGCPQGTFAWCRTLNLSQITAVRVLDRVELFCRSRAKNIGAAAARGAVLAFVDADIRLDPGWLAAVVPPLEAGEADLLHVNRHGDWDRGGTCAVSHRMFHQMRGYDESLEGWGDEDRDLYRRAARLGRVGWFNARMLHPIRHGDRERTRYHAHGNRLESLAINQRRIRDRRDAVNPDGFGLAACEIRRGAGDAVDAAFPLRYPAKRLRRPIRSIR